jgi:hypothetical protein
MTVISVFTKLLFGPNPGSDHIVKTSLEAPVSEDFGENLLSPMPEEHRAQPEGEAPEHRGGRVRHDRRHEHHEHSAAHAHYRHPYAKRHAVSHSSASVTPNNKPAAATHTPLPPTRPHDTPSGVPGRGAFGQEVLRGSGNVAPGSTTSGDFGMDIAPPSGVSMPSGRRGHPSATPTAGRSHDVTPQEAGRGPSATPKETGAGRDWAPHMDPRGFVPHQRVKTALIRRGFSPEDASAITGNLIFESGGNQYAGHPVILNPPTGGHSGDAAWGSAQWEHPRKEHLSSPSLDAQVEQIWNEMHGPEARSYEAMRRARTIAEKAHIVNTMYERPGQYQRRASDRERIRAAEEVFRSREESLGVEHASQKRLLRATAPGLGRQGMNEPGDLNRGMQRERDYFTSPLHTIPPGSPEMPKSLVPPPDRRFPTGPGNFGVASTRPLPHPPAPPASKSNDTKDNLFPMPGETIEQYRQRQDRILNRRVPRPGWGYPKGTEREDV